MGKRRLRQDSAMGTVCPVKGYFSSTGVTRSPCSIHKRKNDREE